MPTTIPTTVLGLMTLIITTLAGVIVWQQRRIDKLQGEKSELQDKRLADAITFSKRYDTIMGKFSLSFDLFVAKLEATRGRKH